MAIKAECIGVKEELKREYPYLGETNTGDVVLFVAEDTGMLIVKKASSHKLGEFGNVWAEEYFTPLSPSKSITLRNDQ